jgi:hypothetical protein
MSTGSDPFKMTTVALLVVAVVMALVFSTKAMDREVKERERLEAAKGEVEAVSLFLDEGDIPNAIVALHDIGMRLAEIEGAEEAAGSISAAVQAEFAAHEATRAELARARKDAGRTREYLTEANRKLSHQETRSLAAEMMRDRNSLVVTNLANGRVDLARRVLAGAESPDVVSKAAAKLVERIDALNRLSAVAGDERVRALTSIARNWSIPGLAAVATELGEARRRDGVAREALSEAAESYQAKNYDLASGKVSEALKAHGLGKVADLLEAIADARLAARIRPALEKGKLAEAAALHRVRGNPELAHDLEARIFREALAGELVRIGRERINQKRFFLAAGFFEVAGQVSGDTRLADESLRTEGAGFLKQAEDYLKNGRPEMALAEARRAVPTVGARAEQFVNVVEGALAEKQSALTSIAIRVALHAGDGKEALKLLAAVDENRPEKRDLLAEANLLAGDLAKGSAALPEEKEARTARALSFGWQVLAADPVRAARLGLLAVETTGPRPGALALLTASIEAAGDDLSDPVWSAVKKEIFKAAALPGEK